MSTPSTLSPNALSSLCLSFSIIGAPCSPALLRGTALGRPTLEGLQSEILFAEALNVFRLLVELVPVALLGGHHYLAHTGVQPDQEVWLERDDVAVGRDTVVEAAIRWIKGRWPLRPTARRQP